MPYRYAFQGDIVKYFPSIDHAILRSLLARQVADHKTLWLMDQIMNSGAGVLADEYPMTYFPQDDPWAHLPPRHRHADAGQVSKQGGAGGSGQGLFAALRPRGLPIGNLTSQFWANVYLHELDRFVKHRLRCPAYLRYMDDFVLFADDKAQLHEFKSAVRDFLATRLRLVLHPKKSLVFPVKVGVDFCGFRIYPTHPAKPDAGSRRLRKSSVRRFVRRFRRQRESYRRGELTLEEMTHSVRSWTAHAAHGDTYRLLWRLFADYPLRAPE